MNGIKAAYELISVPLSAAGRIAGTSLRREIRGGREYEYGDAEDQRIIIYEPKQDPKDDVIVFLPGGLAGSGRPELLKHVASFFVREGYIFIALGTRALSAEPLNHVLQDGVTAYAVAMKVLEELGYEDRGVVLGGISYGALIATHIAYGQNAGEQYDPDLAKLKGVISVSGIMDAEDLYRAKLIRNSDRRRKNYVPDVFLSEYDPEKCFGTKLIAVHGKQDQVAPYRTVRNVVNAVNAMSGRDDQATLYALTSWKSQHVRVGDGIFMENPKKSRVLRFLLRWISQLAKEPEEEAKIRTPIQDAVKAEKRAKKVAEQAAAGHENI